VFIKDVGGFGGAPPPEEPWPSSSVPDLTVKFATRPEQALLYRLSADRNPLHSDPTAAAASGFGRPILQGMCTFGFCGRLLLHAICGGNPACFRSLDARFVRRVVPGEALTLTGWRVSTETRFRVANAAGAIVVDDGRLIACASRPAPEDVRA
jgi:acyl dehydratase